MISATITAVYMTAVLHQCCVTTDEAVRYAQLVDMERSRAAVAVVDYVDEYWEPAYYEPYWMDYDTSDGISAAEFEWLGVVEENGTKYTWYSQRVLPGGGLDELNSNGRHVEGGFVMDGDGYIAVASSDHQIGTVVDTPFGEAKVYDTGCESGTVDVYTNF